MNEAEYVASVHRREQWRANAIFDLIVLGLFAIGFAVWKLAC